MLVAVRHSTARTPVQPSPTEPTAEESQRSAREVSVQSAGP